MTKVVHCRRSPFDVFIGRPSKWGNPFKIGRDGSREEVIEKFRKYFFSNPELMEAAQQELEGKALGCFCFPLPCHGDILANFLNGINEN